MIVAIYDADCKLCRRFASILRKAVSPTELDVVPCGSPIQKKLAPAVSEETCLAAFTVVDATGKVRTGGDAVTHVLTLSPRLKSYRWMVERGPGSWLAHAAYILAVRMRRGGCSGCGGKKSK